MHDYYEITFKIRFNPALASSQERDTFESAFNILSIIGCAVRKGENGAIVVTSGGWQGVEAEPTNTPLKSFDLFDSITSDCIAFSIVVNDGWNRKTFERTSKSVRNITRARP